MEKLENQINTGKTIFLDAHCHLQFFVEKQDIDKSIKYWEKHNLLYLLTNSTSEEDFEVTDNLSKNNLNRKVQIIPNFGFHPWYLKKFYDEETLGKDSISSISAFLEDIINKKIKENLPFGLGEIGIDNYFPIKHTPLEFQVRVFLKQLEIADKYKLFTTVHCVRAYDDLIKIMLEYVKKNKNSDIFTNKKILLHSYGGNFSQTKKLLKSFNLWFSISPGCIKERMIKSIEYIPLENIILESDAPSMFNMEIYKTEEEVLSLKEHYVKEDDTKENSTYRNNPLSIMILCKRISEIKKIDYEKTIEALQKNNSHILSLFNIKNNN